MSAIIIPAAAKLHRHIPFLSRTIEAARSADVHVIVVDNGITDRRRSSVRRVLDDHAVEILRCTERGSYKARNVGLRHALEQGYDTLYLTDVDCRAAAEWFAHSQGLLENADVVQGRTRVIGSGHLARGGDYDYQKRFDEWVGSARCGAGVRGVDTRNLVLTSEALRSFGFFDERLRYGADALWGRRALHAGARILGCDHYLVSHSPPKSLATVAFKYARIAMALAAELQRLPRRDVVAYLPEHAHLLLRHRAPTSWDLLRSGIRFVRGAVACRLARANAPECNEVSVAVRYGWSWGRYLVQRKAGRSARTH